MQIIDGFQVNVARPIDSRIVASGSTARNAIAYKYEGLRVFDTSDGIPYVWLSGAWVSENSTGVIGSSTTANYIPKFTATNVVGNSVIYQNGSNVGVGVIPSSLPGTYKLDVDGSIYASGGFVGDGSNLTDLNATSISSGNLSLTNLSNGSNSGYILTSGVSYPSYVNPSLITVGTASAANSVLVKYWPSDSTAFNLAFVSPSSLNIFTDLKSSPNFTYVPSGNTLNLVNGTVSASKIKTDGINFPATQVSSSDVNTLDDYEEGTWTPVINGTTSGITYTSAGTYTKIGKVIFIGGYIKFTAVPGVGADRLNYIPISCFPYSLTPPTGSANIGVWTINNSSLSFMDKYFSTDPFNMDNGMIISSSQISTGSNLYFSSTSGSNPLDANCAVDSVISFSLTFIT